MLQEGGQLAHNWGSGHKLGYGRGGQVGAGVARVIQFTSGIGGSWCYTGGCFRGDKGWGLLLLVDHFQSFGLSGRRLSHCLLLQDDENDKTS